MLDRLPIKIANAVFDIKDWYFHYNPTMNGPILLRPPTFWVDKQQYFLCPDMVTNEWGLE